MLHMEGKLFESRRCLLLVPRDYIGSREFTIYEMRKGCSVWSIMYLVDTDDFMSPFPEGWLIWSIVWSIVLGEREVDSFLVINMSGKIIEYNLISNTLPCSSDSVPTDFVSSPTSIQCILVSTVSFIVASSFINPDISLVLCCALSSIGLPY
ncbi:hypothetical protein Tco_0985759 [Tanacetum coccineum]